VFIAKALRKTENSEFCTFANLKTPIFLKFSEITKILCHN
jgi:hypothetical protein